MGGTLTAHSEGAGTGATMCFMMPLYLPDAEDAADWGGSPAPERGLSRANLPGGASTHDNSAERMRRFHASLSSIRSCAVTAEPSPNIPATELITSPALDVEGGDSPAPVVYRALVAEDDRLSQTLLRKLLPKMGFEPTIVENGALLVDVALAAAPGGAWAR